MSYVLGIGHAALDRVAQVDVFPRADEKARVTPLLEGGGGPAATAMVTVARLGGRSLLCAAVGDDGPGRRILEELQSEGVDVGAVQVRPGHRSPVSFVVVEKTTASRTILWDAGDAPMLSPEEIPPGVVEEAGVLLVDGHQGPAQQAAARRARAAGVPVVLDGGTLRPATRELLPLADHAVVSGAFARQLAGRAGEQALAALQAAGPAMAVITRGGDGCLASDAQGVVAVPALPVEALDTNGAGDVFHGAYALALAQGRDLGECLRLASAAAGLSCRAFGARPGIPCWNDAAEAAAELA
jgi:sugar/nucleoside kinase (ribokinase family)